MGLVALSNLCWRMVFKTNLWASHTVREPRWPHVILVCSDRLSRTHPLPEISRVPVWRGMVGRIPPCLSIWLGSFTGLSFIILVVPSIPVNDSLVSGGKILETLVFTTFHHWGIPFVMFPSTLTCYARSFGSLPCCYWMRLRLVG